MYKNTTVKKSLILLVAALLAVAVLLSACGPKPFKGVTKPSSTTDVDSNGGIAVRYGEWIYYVNGYESSANAENTYVDTTDAPRVGSIVRIKAAEIANILAIHDEDMTSSEKTKAIAKAVAEKAETVVPRIYYTANTSTATLNGIYIFNDRIYILTPNDQLTAGGNSRTNESVLMSYDLGGGNEQRHYTFTNNSAQIKLYVAEGKVMATYLMSNQLHVLTLGETEKDAVDTLIAGGEDGEATVSSVNFNVEDRVYFIDSNGSICQLLYGQTKEQIVVKDVEDWKISYTISSVNGEYVYYTVAYENNSAIDGAVLYYANGEQSAENAAAAEESAYARNVALETANITAYGWKADSVVIVRQNGRGYFGLYILAHKEGKVEEIQVLKPGFNSNSITINKIEGNDLYYTAGGVTYIKDLNEFIGGDNDEGTMSLGTPYAASWSMSPSSGTWAAPDLVKVKTTVDEKEDVITYMFTLGTGTVSVVKFDPVKKTNSTSAALTLTVITED